MLHIQERFTLNLQALEAYFAHALHALSAQTSRQAGVGTHVLRLTLAGVHTQRAYISASTRWLARNLWGNGEWSLRPHAPPTALVEIVGRKKGGRIGLSGVVHDRQL